MSRDTIITGNRINVFIPIDSASFFTKMASGREAPQFSISLTLAGQKATCIVKRKAFPLHGFLFSDMISTMEKQMGATCSLNVNGGGQDFDFFNVPQGTI